MRKRFLKFSIVPAVLVAGLGWYCWRSSNPTYDGRTVSECFEQYASSGSFGGLYDEDAHEEATLGLQMAGTNAVPYLMEEAFTPRRYSYFKVGFYAIKRCFQRNVGRLPTPLEIQVEAADALRVIRPPATMLLPFLTNALNSTDTITRRQAIYILGCLDEGAETGTPYLIRALKDNDPIARGLAAQSLGWLGSKGRAAIPAMIEALEDANAPARLVSNLGAFGPEAKGAIPALEARLATRTNRTELLFAAAALYQIDAVQTQAWAIVTNSVSQTNPPQVRRNAFSAMSRIKPVPPEFVPLLIEGARDPDKETAGVAIQALESTCRDTAVAVLLERFDASDVNTRVWAAGWILHIQPSHPRALSLLIDYLIQGETRWRQYAVEQLGHAHAQATNAIALLRSINEKDESKEIRRAAEKALRKIHRKRPD